MSSTETSEIFEVVLERPLIPVLFVLNRVCTRFRPALKGNRCLFIVWFLVTASCQCSILRLLEVSLFSLLAFHLAMHDI